MSEFDDLLENMKKELPDIVASEINELQSKNVDHQVITDFIKTYLEQELNKTKEELLDLEESQKFALRLCEGEY